MKQLRPPDSGSDLSMTANPTLFESFLLRAAAGRVVILFLFHVMVFSACYAFAFLQRFAFSIPPEFAVTMKASFPVVVGLQLLVGMWFGFYRGWWRYVGMADVVRLVFGLSTATVILIGLWYVGGIFDLRPEYVKEPRGVLVIDWGFSLLTLFGARALIRIGKDRFRGHEGSASTVRKVLIIGAGDAGETLAREIEHRPQLGMKIVGFVDDHRAKIGSSIRGVLVRGPIASLAHIADDTGADEALIAIPSASGSRIRQIIQHLSEADLAFKIMPGIDQLVSGKVHVTQLRPVVVEDLLRRERIELPGDPVRDLFRDRRVLITGAGGTIGSELAAQVARFAPEHIILVERSEFALYEVRKRMGREAAWMTQSLSCNLLDICDTDLLEDLINTARPNIVLHAAAHKHVPLGEENPREYLRNNCLATRTLAELCSANGVERFVFVSTDKAINPTSVMGATKRAAEIALLDLANDTDMKMTIVRFGNVIGSSGSVIPLFMEQIADGGPVTVTHPEVTRYFLRTSEAVSLVLQAATLGGGGRVFMLDMGEPVNIADLARDLIRLSNHSEDEIPIVFTGLRPGEKLFEEIRMEGESIHPTVHPQIVITEAPQPDSGRVRHWLARVGGKTMLSRNDAVAAIRELVVEYKQEQLPRASAAPAGAPAPVLQH
jgi:FlaA1/EpsC-like NDP-sugar epimerase